VYLVSGEKDQIELLLVCWWYW